MLYALVGTLIKVLQMLKAELPHAGAKARTSGCTARTAQLCLSVAHVLTSLLGKKPQLSEFVQSLLLTGGVSLLAGLPCAIAAVLRLRVWAWAAVGTAPVFAADQRGLLAAAV